ncbi:hypothetical protein TNCV_3191111 [Trichonephila clavipes]|nr:hypothetical protein TNCV_3191111 [Trichonephila clavipes]
MDFSVLVGVVERTDGLPDTAPRHQTRIRVSIHRSLIEGNLRSCHLTLTTAHCRARLRWLDQVEIMLRGECLEMTSNCVIEYVSGEQRADPVFTIACHTGLLPGIMV